LASGVVCSAGGDGGRLFKKGNGRPKNGNRVCVNNEVKNSKLVERSDVNETRRADTRMTSVEYAGDNPLRLANEIDAALAKYGLGNDHRMCKAIHFLRANYASSLNACAALARRRSQGSRTSSTRGVAHGSMLAGHCGYLSHRRRLRLD